VSDNSIFGKEVSTPKFLTLNYFQGQSSHPFWKFLSFCLTLGVAVFGNKPFADPAGGL